MLFAVAKPRKLPECPTGTQVSEGWHAPGRMTGLSAHNDTDGA